LAYILSRWRHTAVITIKQGLNEADCLVQSLLGRMVRPCANAARSVE
jgi:hypothetical protein